MQRLKIIAEVRQWPSCGGRGCRISSRRLDLFADLVVQGGDLRRPGGVGRLPLRRTQLRSPTPTSPAGPTAARAAGRAAYRGAGAGHLDRPGTGADTGTGGTTEQVPCHPFPRPVRHRALLRGRERRRGTTGPRLLPQRSARRAEGSWSGREETAREAPTLSCRTGRGTSKDSPPQADLDDGAAGATRSVARRVLLARPNGRGAGTSTPRSPVTEPRSTATSRTPLAARSRSRPARRAPGAVSSAMSRAWPGQRPPEGVCSDVVDRLPRPQGPIAQEHPDAHGLHRQAGGQQEEPQVSSGPPVILQVRRHTATRLPSAYRRTCRTPAARPGPSTGCPGADTRRRQMKGLHR